VIKKIASCDRDGSLYQPQGPSFSQQAEDKPFYPLPVFFHVVILSDFLARQETKTEKTIQFVSFYFCYFMRYF